jgi:pyruvate/2-oxoacid:ferredoxin oxidoreductase beta subunit
MYGVWILTNTILSPLQQFEGFGYSLDLSKNYAVIGTANGHAFIYENVNNQWIVVKSLSSTSSSDHFGRAVSIYGETIVIGSPGYQSTVGSVYVYTRTGTQTWTLTNTISSVLGFNSQFGASVSILNDTLAIGAPGYRAGVYGAVGHDAPNNTGNAYVYRYDTGAKLWFLKQSISSPAGRNSYFGVTVKLTSYRLAIGADGYPHGNSTGKAYIFSRTGPNEEYQQNIELPSPAGIDSHFGSSIAVTDTHVAIGAYASSKKSMFSIFVCLLFFLCSSFS